MSVERDNDLATSLESLIAEVSWCLHSSSVPDGRLLFIEGGKSSVSIGRLLLDEHCGWGQGGGSCLRHNRSD
jgi:hypothetical protein